MLIFNNTTSVTAFITALSAYLIISAIVSFDKKQIKMVRKGKLPSNSALLPGWMEYLYWTEIILLVIILLVNWKIGIVVFVLSSGLGYLGLLPKAGSLLIQVAKKLKAS
ncbi:hypothetical protein [Desertivirga arenae]|uniref:hypothetical protein n=1 Tax=Desertivirga arenae TaxID=2810309 RepID=UPI001A97C07C|nr:hypothetical protein [Pedobacter sp. SYSU D00823]